MSATAVVRVESEVTKFLANQLGERMVAAFLYGSVVTGRATSASDIDCFVVSAEQVEGHAATRVGREFAALQRRLGYTPDPDYPIEIFAVDDCRRAFNGAVLRRALDQLAATGAADAGLLLSDELEILRAMTGPRLVLMGVTTLERLTAQALNTIASGLASRRELDAATVLAELDQPSSIGRLG